jgi:hypothetical protein
MSAGQSFKSERLGTVIKVLRKPGMEVHTSNPSTQEAEARVV